MALHEDHVKMYYTSARLNANWKGFNSKNKQNKITKISQKCKKMVVWRLQCVVQSLSFTADWFQRTYCCGRR